MELGTTIIEGHGRFKTKIISNLQCDLCLITYELHQNAAKLRRSKRVANGRDLCVSCIRKENSKNFGKAGTVALEKLSIEERRENARKAGKASAMKSPGDKNKSKFSSAKWNSLSKEDQKVQVMRANAGLQEKLKDPNYRRSHFEKVFQNSMIGYISKFQREVFDFLKETIPDLELDKNVNGMKVDICSEAKKLIIECHGDFWHCNPKTWQSDQHHPIMKMTAKEKWRLDQNRYFYLISIGYKVKIIWESDWKENKEKSICHFI
jgi:hypothetical protein